MRPFALLSVLLAATSAAFPQAPNVGDINVYGVRKVALEKVIAAAGAKTGQPLPGSRGAMEEQIEQVPNVLLSSVEAVCCDGPNVALFIGIEEKGAPHPAFRSTPLGDMTLPQDLTDTFNLFLSAVQRAAARGNTTEDLTAGHSRMDDGEARAFQPKFAAFGAEHLDHLRDVLRNASQAGQRAMAASIMGYAPKKAEIVNDLQYALDDPDQGVRANAIRSLKAIAVLASKQPKLGLKISPTWFVQLLNSVILSDRVEAAKALVILTDRPDSGAIAQLRESAMPSLVEMARWRTLRYALPSFLLLGRVAGLKDEQIQQRWEKGEREPVIEQALAVDAGPKRGVRK